MSQFKSSLLMLLVMSVLLGLVYPLAMTGIAQLMFSKNAGGSLITAGGRITGSRLIGQNFTSTRYFHGRPSAHDYDGANSGGTNLGPTNRKLIDRASDTAARVRRENGLTANARVPSDIVLASGSGLDPHISLESALLQTGRVAAARGIDQPAIIKLVKRSAEKQYAGLFGDPIVNVLELNLSLDALGNGK
jgi:K+-transporting ATPase ATPase C chain